MKNETRLTITMLPETMQDATGRERFAQWVVSGELTGPMAHTPEVKAIAGNALRGVQDQFHGWIAGTEEANALSELCELVRPLLRDNPRVLSSFVERLKGWESLRDATEIPF